MTGSRGEPTLQDVAEVAGVSVATVSRVLNDRGYLSDDTRRRVAQAIRKTGYRPNQAARSLHGKSSRTMGFIVPTLGLPFYGELSVLLDRELARRGYRLVTASCYDDDARESDYVDLLVGQRVDAIMSCAQNVDSATYAALPVPVVGIDRQPDGRVTTISCDNEAGGVLATEHLLERGARAPALLTSRSGPRNLREAGYRRVMEAAGLPAQVFAIDFHMPLEQRELRTFAWLDQVVSGRHWCDAVFATDDLPAATVLDWARRRGVDVPGELKVIGFNGTLTVERLAPELSTVRQPMAEIARLAAQYALAQIQQPTRREGRQPHVELPLELAPRATT